MTEPLLSFLAARRRGRRRGSLAVWARRLDAACDRFVGRRRSRAADHLFFGLSSAADHGLLWLAVAAVRAALVPRHRRSLVRLAAALGTESVVTNGLVKTAFRRLRPLERSGQRLEPGSLPYGVRIPITSAFPSGHAATAFCAATLLADDDPLGPAYFGLASLVAASRVYVRLHHGSDVVAGSAWGLVAGRALRGWVRGR